MRLFWHEQQDQKRKKRTLILLLIALLLILLPLCTVATYTWLGISKTPKVSDMEMTINCDPGLQLAWDIEAEDDEWKQQLDFTDAVGTDTLLTPVTWSDKEKSFYTAKFGADGRIVDIGVRLSDEKDSNGRDGHYVKFTFYGRTEQEVEVSLSPAVSASDDGSKSAGTYLLGTPLWQENSKAHKDGGQGAQFATRVGFIISKINNEGVVTSQKPMLIYEPNCDRHIDGSSGYVDTPSIDGFEDLVGADRLIKQTTSHWEEGYPLERDVIIRDLGVFEDDVTLFQLDNSEKVKIDVYVWLEGMDVDCVNVLGTGAQFFANLQLSAIPDNQSGLVPIQ